MNYRYIPGIGGVGPDRAETFGHSPPSLFGGIPRLPRLALRRRFRRARKFNLIKTIKKIYVERIIINLYNMHTKYEKKYFRIGSFNQLHHFNIKDINKL